MEATIKTSPEMLPLVTVLIHLGFKVVGESGLNFEFGNDDTKYQISVVTDYKPEFLWLQFRKNGVHISENSQTDAYCTNLSEVLLALADYADEGGYMRHQNHVRSVLKV